MWGAFRPAQRLHQQLAGGPRVPLSPHAPSGSDQGVSKNTFGTSDDRNNSVTLGFVVQS